ncbi:VOC family protein [Bacillus carboniphilus]|uniref:VOC family protein n=1 Tax=Bacillus carboniphilus TaxID=86663 RepID=A0ABN0W9N7_9BACI
MKISKIEHVAIIVKDMDKAIDFYQEVFDFFLRARGDTAKRELAFLRHSNNDDVEIELIRDLEPQDGQYSGSGIVNHLAFTVENLEDAVNYYKDKGIKFNSEKVNVSIDGSRNIFFNGPNGELLQLVEPVKR